MKYVAHKIQQNGVFLLSAQEKNAKKNNDRKKESNTLIINKPTH